MLYQTKFMDMDSVGRDTAFNIVACGIRMGSNSLVVWLKHGPKTGTQWVGNAAAAAAAKSLQTCPTLCDPIDSSPPGSPVHGILEERTLEWVAISFSNAWTCKVKVKSLSHVRLVVTPWTAAYLVPPSMGFPRQEYWSGVPSPSPELEMLPPLI